MKIKEVYVDMDGCLCNFVKRFNELYHEDVLIDFPKESNNAKKRRYKEQFRQFIEGNNFATLEPMPDFHIAIPFINKIANKIPTYILSSTATEEYLHELTRQKKEWLKKYDINLYPIFVPGSRLKQLYSREGRVIIDDKYKTIVEWNAMGGTGIHHKNWKETIKEFNKISKE